MILSASRCAARSSPELGGFQEKSPPAAGPSPARSSNRSGCRYRDSQLPRHRWNVDLDAAALGNIDHIQDEKERLAKALKLDDETHREP
jgi:hypothetical protein